MVFDNCSVAMLTNIHGVKILKPELTHVKDTLLFYNIRFSMAVTYNIPPTDLRNINMHDDQKKHVGKQFALNLPNNRSDLFLNKFFMKS